ncbi:nicolin-1 isoform X2 [Syngnathoides biaculeatus]|uniref:nicolin-1 isoform X2 n=1 Tax=Syngnathoides biaculeatus TaxID=300417 RepID=UPI002ADDFE27|nr:nicolin-1 isoform X2 [Syngnathoides biaculeatus]
MSADDATKGVACTLKPPVFLHLGGGDAKTHSGVCVIDVALPPGKTVNIETITFKNFYTASVSVRLQRRRPGQEGAAEWRTALGDRPLMVNPHTEAGAQDYCNIDRKQMRAEPDDVCAVRLILKQPSAAWRTFGVEDVRIFPRTQPVCRHRRRGRQGGLGLAVGPRPGGATPPGSGPGGRRVRLVQSSADVGLDPSDAEQPELRDLRRTL